MMDNLDPSQATPQTTEVVEEAPKSPSFFATSLGKMVIAAIALLVLLVIGGVVAYFFLSSGTSEAPVVPPASQQPATPGEQAAEPVEPDEPEASDTFAFRNIFKPSIKAPSVESTSGDAGGDTGGDGGGSSDGGGTDAATDELKLVSIQTNNGTRTATLQWNGETYELEEGESIPDSPWKVVDIGTDTVSVIYGDSSPIELSVGDAVSK